MSDRHRHTADSLSRPREPICAPPPPRRVALPPLRSRPVKAVTLRASALLVQGGQGRDDHDVHGYAGAWIVCGAGLGFIALIVALGHLTRWFA
jgi:hypothetical protein